MDGATEAESRPQRNPSIEQSDLRDGIVLFDPQRQMAHHLNAVATLVWELIDGRSLAEITAAVATILEIDQRQAQSYTDDAVSQFRSTGLVS